MRLHNIINGRLRDSADLRAIGPWQVARASDYDVALALKVVRSTPATPRAEAVEILRRIGKRAAWIGEGELRELARQQRIPLFHLQSVKRRIDSWMSSMDDYVERVVNAAQPTDGSVLRTGDVTTAIVLAGNDFVVAPFVLIQALLAEARVVVKASGADPLTPYRFVRALVDEGASATQLLFIDGSGQGGAGQVRTLLEGTEQSVVFGEDATVHAVYDNLGPGMHAHKKIPYWTGRSGVIVHDDADLGAAARCIVESATWNSGRSCVNSKKVFAAGSIAAALEANIAAEAARLRRRPYDDYYCDIGEQSAEAREVVLREVSPADLILGDDLVVCRASPQSTLVREELPYPVVALVRGADQDLVRLANQSVAHAPSRRSMSMAVFTRERSRFDAACRELAAYKVTWNGTTNPFWIYDVHQGMYLFSELMRTRGVCVGRPSGFERGRPLERPWPW